MNSALEKIKKLLRLSKDKGATAAEAAAALLKAQQIADANGVDLNSVPADDPDAGVMRHVTAPSPKGVPHQVAAGIVRKYFAVDTLFDGRRSRNDGKRVIHFIGADSNCEIARYIYIYLVRLMRDAWTKRTNRRLRDRDAFIRGFGISIERLIPATFNTSGLVLSADHYIEAIILAGHGVIKTGKLSKKKPMSDAAFREGWLAGMDATIHNAVSGNDQLALGNQ